MSIVTKENSGWHLLFLFLLLMLRVKKEDKQQHSKIMVCYNFYFTFLSVFLDSYICRLFF